MATQELQGRPAGRQTGGPRDMKTILCRFALSLAIGTAGGILAWWVGLPAPWLAGAMTATAAAALSGMPVEVPDVARAIVFTVLGLQIGASATPEAVATMARWPVSMALLVATVVAIIWAVSRHYQSHYGWQRITAILGSNPGALSLNLALAEHYRADVSKVTIVQSMRLFFIVALLPAAITAIGGGLEEAVRPAKTAGTWDLAITILVGGSAGVIAGKIGVPAGYMIGAALASGALHLTGVVSGILPDWLMIPGFIALGCLTGSRFTRFDWTALKELASAGTTGFVIALGLAAAGAGLAAHFTGVPYVLALLAFAPGGVDVMIMLSFALQLEPMFVAGHQLFRMLMLMFGLPLVLQIFERPPEPISDANQEDTSDAH